MKKSIIIIASAVIGLLIAGCVSTDDLNDALYSWIGATEDEIILGWGLPTSTYSTATTRFLIYKVAEDVAQIESTTVDKEEKTDTVESDISRWFIDDSVTQEKKRTTGTETTTTSVQVNECTVEFAFQDNVVTGVNHRGTPIIFPPGSYCNYYAAAGRFRSRY